MMDDGTANCILFNLNAKCCATLGIWIKQCYSCSRNLGFKRPDLNICKNVVMDYFNAPSLDLTWGQEDRLTVGWHMWGDPIETRPVSRPPNSEEWEKDVSASSLDRQLSVARRTSSCNNSIGRTVSFRDGSFCDPAEIVMSDLTFTQRDLNSYSQPSRTALFPLGI